MNLIKISHFLQIAIICCFFSCKTQTEETVVKNVAAVETAAEEAAAVETGLETKLIYRENLLPIVKKSLAFHDPRAVFDQAEISCNIVSTTAKDTTQRKRKVVFNTAKGSFSMQQKRDGKEESFQVPIPTSLIDSTVIARSMMYKKYFRYMLGGANVLADSAAIIEESVKDTLFNNLAAKEISVKYEQPVDETPHWYFTIDANTGEMLQSRFVYNEGKENERGEFINYGPYVSYKGMQLTSELNWYYLNGDFLAKEKIEYLD